MAKASTLLADKRIIVTGGAGFIGSRIVGALNGYGCKLITVVDHLANNGKWRNLVGLKFESYCDRDDFLRRLEDDEFERADIVIHMGACAATTEQDENFLLYNNSIYSQRLSNWCFRKKKRLIYASSAATYGDGNRGYSDTERELEPLNCYGFSKYLFDQWMLDSSDKPPQWVGLKFFNVYGPNEYHKGRMASVVYHGFRQVEKEGKISLFKSYRADYPDGGQKRDFVYVKDVTRVVKFFLDNPQISGIFNVGTGEARTFSDLAKPLFSALGKEPEIQYIEMPEPIREKYQYFTRADLTSLRRVGYKENFISIEEGVRDYVINYLTK